MSALPNWTEMDSADRDDLIRRYVSEGLSAAKIAQRFANATRSAVIGRVRRMGLSCTGRPKSAPKKLKAVRPQSKTSGLSATNIAVRKESREEAPGLIISTAAAFDPIPGVEPVPYGSPGCKFPVDGMDGPGLLWCGADRGDHPTYCASHRRLAFTPRHERAA